MSSARKLKSLKQILLIQQNFVFQLAIGIYYVTTLLGITSFVFDRRKAGRQQRANYEGGQQRRLLYPRLRISSALRWYSLMLLLLTIALTPFATYTLYTQMYFLSLTKLLSVIGHMRFTILQGFAVFVMLLNFRTQCRSVRFLNRWLGMQYTLHELACSLKHMRAVDITRRLQLLDQRSCVLLIAKLLLMLLTPAHLCYVAKGERALHRPALLASMLINYYCVLVLQMTNVLFSVCAIRVGHYGQQINVLLRQALEVADERLNGQRPLNCTSRQRVFNLSEVISRLHRLHTRNVLLSRELVRIYSPMLLTFFFSVFMVCSIQLFVFYFATCTRFGANYSTGGVISSNVLSDKCSSPNFMGLMQVFALLPDMCVVVFISHLMQSYVADTNVILAEYAFRLPAPRGICTSQCCEVQLEAALSEFSLYLRMEQQQRYNLGQEYAFFMTCGLFALERRLIFEICETILNYLIILVQYYD
ncbi:PREDICTED: putative gustatory receptor 77a, partial [Rhagoletis zephyria]|uniref:putative gustatory receptor 77a n=1 Tax=Rhagoletis zephyria TaxID=28612 RepID=UPI0008117587